MPRWTLSYASSTSEMTHLLPLTFIALAALALIGALLFLWHSVREALTPAGEALLGNEIVSRERAALLSEKHSLLIALRDLEAEREAGKLSQEDFSELSGRYRARAREVLRALDEQLAPHRASAKALLESALGSANPAAPAGKSDPVLSAGVNQQHQVCACGVVNDIDAVFCKKCGARLGAGQGA
jgi:hypothetical protein